MAIIIIMAFTMLFMWGTVVFCYQNSAVENGKYVLGITLSAQHRREEEVLEIREDYRRVMKKINLLGLAGGVFVLLLCDYLSLVILALMIWFGLLIYFHQENVERCARRLYRVKQKNGWLTGNAHVVRIDTVLSSIRDKGAVSFWWMIPAYLAGFAGCIYAWQQKAGAALDGEVRSAGSTSFPWVIFVTFAGTEFLFFLIYAAIRKAKAQVVCGDTAINQKLDRTVRREWSRCMVLHAYGMAAFTVCMGWLNGRSASVDRYPDTGGIGAAGTLVLFGMLGSVCTLYVSWRNVKKVREQVYDALSESGTEIYGDDDEYWLNGYPAGMRPSGFAEKRIGIGWTTNHSLKSTTADKAVMAMIGIFCVGICLFLMPYDFAQIKMEIADGRCRVSAASMGGSFALEDVEQIMLMPQRPSMSKRNGYDSNRFFLGDFRVQGYGTCKTFVSVKNNMVIMVETKDRFFWFNSESREETLLFYETLMEAMEDRLPGGVKAQTES